MHVVAILETMWDWRGMTSGAGYAEAPRYFRIHSDNYSGKRLYKLIGPDARLLVTNACRELVTGPQHHGKGNPEWLKENLEILDGCGPLPDGATQVRFDVLLVCGKVAQKTYEESKYSPQRAAVLYMPHPAARMYWTKEQIAATANRIRVSYEELGKERAGL